MRKPKEPKADPALVAVLTATIDLSFAQRSNLERFAAKVQALTRPPFSLTGRTITRMLREGVQ